MYLNPSLLEVSRMVSAWTTNYCPLDWTIADTTADNEEIKIVITTKKNENIKQQKNEDHHFFFNFIK